MVTDTNVFLLSESSFLLLLDLGSIWAWECAFFRKHFWLKALGSASSGKQFYSCFVNCCFKCKLKHIRVSDVPRHGSALIFILQGFVLFYKTNELVSSDGMHFNWKVKKVKKLKQCMRIFECFCYKTQFLIAFHCVNACSFIEIFYHDLKFRRWIHSLYWKIECWNSLNLSTKSFTD